MKFLPINFKMLVPALISAPIIHNGPSGRKGWEGRITQVDARTDKVTVFWVAADLFQDYSLKWFADNVLVAVSHLQSPDNINYISQYIEYMYDSTNPTSALNYQAMVVDYNDKQAAAKKREQHDDMATAIQLMHTAIRQNGERYSETQARKEAQLETLREKIEKALHASGHMGTVKVVRTKTPEFDGLNTTDFIGASKPDVKSVHRFKEPDLTACTWVAVSGSHILHANSETGIKAHVALALAQNKSREYEIFAKVSNAKLGTDVLFS